MLGQSEDALSFSVVCGVDEWLNVKVVVFEEERASQGLLLTGTRHRVPGLYCVKQLIDAVVMLFVRADVLSKELYMRRVCSS